MSARRALLLIPQGKRDSLDDDLLAGIRQRLSDGGLVVEEPAVADPKDLAAQIAGAADKADLLVLGGGDGTMSAAANALLEAELPFAVLPLGTANDLARSLGLPLDPVAAAEVVASGRLRRIDLGRINGRCFFNVASIGLSVAVTEALDDQEKSSWGPLSYALALRRAWQFSRSFHVEVESEEGRVMLRSILLAVGNGRHHGGGLTVAENATIDDGVLDLYSLEPQSRWRLALMLPALRSGTHGWWRNVTQLRATRFVLRTRRPMKVNVDGELNEWTPATLEVLPGVLQVVVAPEKTQESEEPEGKR